MADDAEVQVSEQETPVEQTTTDSQPEEQNKTLEGLDSKASELTETREIPVPAFTDSNEQNKDKNQSQEQTSEKPLSRRSAAYRVQQLLKENQELKKQAKPAEPAQDEWEIPLEEENQPDIAALIAREVEKRLHPVISESSKNADDGEISELFSGEKAEDRPKYEDRIRSMWNQPQYKDVAAKDLYKIAKYDEIAGSMDMVRQQAVEDYKKAQVEARNNSSGGSTNTSNRAGKSGKSVSEMTDKELLEHNERVKAGLA